MEMHPEQPQELHEETSFGTTEESSGREAVARPTPDGGAGSGSGGVSARKPDVWDELEEDVVLERQPRTAVYTNPFGAVVIRQEAASCEPDEDAVVLIRPEHAEAVAQAIMREARLILAEAAPQAPPARAARHVHARPREACPSEELALDLAGVSIGTEL